MHSSRTKSSLRWLSLHGMAASLALVAMGLFGMSCASQSQQDALDYLEQALNIDGGEVCVTLFAGQTIDAGTVCSRVDGDNLLVSYATHDGWEILETHLWAGADLADMPQTQSGNPKIGKFPWASGSLMGVDFYEFAIPLDNFYIESEEELCDTTLYVAAHAVVQKLLDNDTYNVQTGWGDGEPMVEQGNWATYFSFTFTCEPEEPYEPSPAGCETAFAFGDRELNDIVNANRWGWQITVGSGDSLSTPIYAGAGQNDITKGTYVGDLTISYDGNTLSVQYDLFAGFGLDETHVYAGDVYTTTAAPGQYGNQHEDLAGAGSDSYTIQGSGDPIYVVAHAVVCGSDSVN